MSFVPSMDGFSYCGIILSICFLIQPATVTTTGVSNRLCISKETALGNIEVKSSSESSVLVTWDYPACEYNESDAATVPNLFFNQQGDHLALKYNPFRIEKWPSLVHDPASDVYLAQYDVDRSFYSLKTMNLSDVKRYLVQPTRMRVNVTNLPFPGWTYAFFLDGVIGKFSYRFAKAVGRTSPATPEVCAGCFRTLWTRSLGDRMVRVYFPRRLGQEVSFLLTVYAESYNDTKMTKVSEREISVDYYGYVDELIGTWRHAFRFRELDPYAGASSRDSIIFVPDEQKMLKWVPSISTTIDKNTTTNIRILSWEKPIDFDDVKFYTLVWYDKKNWRENQDCSPIMDWIYIPGNLTSIKLKMVGSENEDDEHVGWRLIANTEASSSGLQEFDG